MSKHDRSYHEKQGRNSIYALKYRQLICEECKHRSSVKRRCSLCGGRMKERRH